MKLKGKVIVITGSSEGIGRTTAIKLSKEGANIVLSARSKKELESLCSEINNYGKAIAVAADVTKEKDMKNLIEQTIKNFGKLDVMINNAGIYSRGKLIDIDENEWDKVINTNLKGVFLGSKYALKEMIKQGKGQIINIASVSGKTAAKETSLYSASKAGVIALSKSLQKEVKGSNISVIILCPSAVDTRLFDKYPAHISRSMMMKPKKIANKIYKIILKNKKSKLIYITKPTRVLAYVIKRIFHLN